MVPVKRASAGALPLFAPVDGVVTGWKVNSNVEYSVVRAHAGLPSDRQPE